MTLRAFLSTVPMAAVALALPAKAEPRYIAVMDPCSVPERTPEPKSRSRGYEIGHDMAARIVTFKTVERSDGDYMSATRTIHDSPHAAEEVARLYRECERWTRQLGENPLYP